MTSRAVVSGLDRLVEAVEAAEAAAALKTPPRQVPGGFECPHPACKRVFSKRYNQQAHMRLHDGTRPFRCELCGKAFRWKSSLKSHAKMHAKISAAETAGDHSTHRAGAKRVALPARNSISLVAHVGTTTDAGVGKRKWRNAAAASRVGGAKKKAYLVTENKVVARSRATSTTGLSLKLPPMTEVFPEKNRNGRKSPDSISMVDHAAATVLTMFR